ncbi:MAG: XdhC family protein, partial [Syntrophorhabdus sp.]
MSIFENIRDDLAAGKRGILATVMVRTGSAPRDVGAKMYISSDGTSYGTVGGGLLEHDVEVEALKNPDLESARVLHVRMDSKSIQEQGMICGGNVDILLEPVRDNHREIYARLAEMAQKARRGIIATSLDNSFTKTLIEDNLSMTGDAIDPH